VKQFDTLLRNLSEKQPGDVKIILQEPLDESDENQLIDLLSEMKNLFCGELTLVLSHSHDHFKPIRTEILEAMKGARYANSTGI